jgi:hypothetical protein
LRAALFIPLLIAGCDGCEGQRPYTPFGVASSPPLIPPSSSESAEPAPSASVEAPKFAARPAEIAPRNATRWKLGARELEAPAGRVFERGVAADFDANGAVEAVAWTLPAGDPAAPPTGSGELWLFPAEGAARRLSEQPSFVPIAPGCRATPQLTQTGPRSVTLDISARCDARLVARTPVRAIAIVAPLAERPSVLTLRAAESAPAETLAFAVDSSDRDGDGLDDARVTVSLRSEGATRGASADLIWLDRAAGVSREAREPARSLARAAASEVWRAKSKQKDAKVEENVATLRRLYASLCAEGGTARVFDADGSALGCGDARPFVDDLASAEFAAALARKDFVDAAGVLARDGWYHARGSDDRRARLVKGLEGAVTKLEVTAIVDSAARPPARTAAPRWSPLRFDATGNLFAQTLTNTVRIGAGGAVEPVAEDAGVTPHPLEVERTDKSRWSAVSYSCDRSEVVLDFATPGGAAGAPIVTRLIAPRPGACKGQKAPALPTIPLSMRASGLEAIVGGSYIGSPAARTEAALRPEQPGSARSPDGRELVVPTALGLLVTSLDSAELWRGAALGDASTLTDCVVANARARVACVRDGHVVVVDRPSPKP